MHLKHDINKVIGDFLIYHALIAYLSNFRKTIQKKPISKRFLKTNNNHYNYF